MNKQSTKTYTVSAKLVPDTNPETGQFEWQTVISVHIEGFGESLHTLTEGIHTDFAKEAYAKYLTSCATYIEKECYQWMLPSDRFMHLIAAIQRRIDRCIAALCRIQCFPNTYDN